MDYRLMPGVQVLCVAVYAPAKRSAGISFAVLPSRGKLLHPPFFATFLPIFLQVSKFKFIFAAGL